MLFSEYKERALTIMSKGLPHSTNKTKDFDSMLAEFNYIIEFFVNEKGHVTLDAEKRLIMLEEDIVCQWN